MERTSVPYSLLDDLKTSASSHGVNRSRSGTVIQEHRRMHVSLTSTMERRRSDSNLLIDEVRSIVQLVARDLP